jgi:tetratricopeptide (TPR) repeat protein
LEENIDVALAIFEINTKLFPNAWNAHNSYGEALRKKARLKESLASFQKSVQLNPENQFGVNAISELEKELETEQE